MKAKPLQSSCNVLPFSAEAVTDNSATLRIQYDPCHGSMDVFVSSVQNIIASCPDEIIVDLDKIGTVDSSGLRALLSAARLCKTAGIRFRLENVSDCVARIAEVSGLSEILGLPEHDLPKIPVAQNIDLQQQYWKTQQFVAISAAHKVAELRDKIVAQAEEAGACGIDLCDIKIAVGEAISNAFRHGSPDKETNIIQVKCMTSTQAVVVEVQDEGETFDPDNIAAPDPNMPKDNGMGIYIMRNAMDLVKYSFNHPGNRVRMVKWLGGRNHQ